MITIGANGEKIAYGVKHFNLDTNDDLQKMPKNDLYMGSTVFVISTSKYYMLNGNYEWIEISPFGSSSSGGGSEGDSDIPTGDVIYDGGLLG